MKNSLYVSIFFLVFGVLVSVFAVNQITQNSALESEGIIVSSLDTEGNTDVLKNGSHSIKEISPKFKTKQGDIYSCRAKIDDDMLARLQTNPVVNIRYLVDKPSVCEVVGGKQQNRKVMLFIGASAVFGSLIKLLSLLQSHRT